MNNIVVQEPVTVIEFTEREKQLNNYILSRYSKRPGKICKRLKMTFKTLCKVNKSILDKLSR
jgi:hypothetical protein